MNSRKAFAASLTIHIIAGASLFASWKFGAVPEVKEEYIDLAYETLEAPPAPAEEVKKVMKSPEPAQPVEQKTIPDNAPKELQDEKSEVAGTEAQVKPE